MVGSLAGGGPGGQDTGLQAAPSPRRGSLRHGRRAGDGGRNPGRVLRGEPARRDTVALDAAGRLGLAVFSATAVTFGPACNGYGLFLPAVPASSRDRALSIISTGTALGGADTGLAGGLRRGR